MEEQIRALLLGTTAVTSLVGNRVDWNSRQQGSDLPCVVLWVIDDSQGHDMAGPDGLSHGRVQADCYGATYAQAKQTSRAVLAVLDGYKGGDFAGVFHAGTRDGREGGTNEADRPFRVQLDFLTHWRP